MENDKYIIYGIKIEWLDQMGFFIFSKIIVIYQFVNEYFNFAGLLVKFTEILKINANAAQNVIPVMILLKSTKEDHQCILKTENDICHDVKLITQCMR